jgi:DNA invertase Pin-like site-specific DNA recombinase
MDIYKARQLMTSERKTIFDLDINVTFYARVSTLSDEQENSIENQISYFTEMIKSNAHWNYVEGYVDRVRGESAENRESFMQMIDDGKSGKFDLVLTKEVSRFARNTIDSLTYTRELLSSGVGVFFQNDNICTIDPDSELRLTIMSSIAADEVRKLSERVRFGHKRAIKNGNVLGNNRIF